MLATKQLHNAASRRAVAPPSGVLHHRRHTAGNSKAFGTQVAAARSSSRSKRGASRNVRGRQIMRVESNLFSRFARIVKGNNAAEEGVFFESMCSHHLTG